jgi:hypothetical protein
VDEARGRPTRGVILVALLLVSAGCAPLPTGPTETYPFVAGDYTGSATVVVPEVPVTATYSAKTSVAQSGAAVIIAPIVFTGEAGAFSLPMGQSTIDAAGRLMPSTTVQDAGCGVYTVAWTGGFLDGELQISGDATSPTCPDFSFTVAMSR